ncbi:MAG: hypothetical protein K1X66_01925 [Verrucomicrobiae bacterium]|nr:hypothetical protein [Verrucomicrobiae bacterium]
MKRFSYWVLSLFFALFAVVGQAKGLIKAVDADGRTWVLNQPGRVMVVIGNNARTADEARKCGKTLDCFQGRKDFRCLVLVDLRGSMANWSKGYTIRRMQRDLDQEAERVRPFYLKNTNQGDPRDEIGAVADFRGEVCEELGWPPNQRELRVIIFGKDGKIAKRFEPVTTYKAVREETEELLKEK